MAASQLDVFWIATLHVIVFWNAPGPLLLLFEVFAPLICSQEHPRNRRIIT
jgi:hypothetical protein